MEFAKGRLLKLTDTQKEQLLDIEEITVKNINYKKKVAGDLMIVFGYNESGQRYKQQFGFVISDLKNEIEQKKMKEKEKVDGKLTSDVKARITQSEYEKLKQIAHEQGMNASETIRFLIRAYQ